MNKEKIQDKLNIVNLSSEAKKFYDNWESQLEYINTTMRAIRKVQTDSTMLNLCVNDASILEKQYNGYVFDKIERPNKFNQYTVYIPDIKMFTRVNIKESLHNYTCCKFKIYLIQDGITLKRKIRVEQI